MTSNLVSSRIFICPGRFLVNIAACLSCFFILYVYIVRHGTNNSPFNLILSLKPRLATPANESALVKNESNLSRNEFKIFSFTQSMIDFHALTKSYCNVHILNQPECFQKLDEFDKSIREKSSDEKIDDYDADQRRFCEYSPDGMTIETFLHHTFFHYDLKDVKNR
jgi:hypothetical protein